MHSISVSLIRNLQESRRKAISYKAIAKEFNLSPATVLKYCRKVELKGSGKRILEINEQVNREKFAEVYAKVKKIRKPLFSKKFSNLLGHLFFDGSVNFTLGRYDLTYTNASQKLVHTFNKNMIESFDLKSGKISKISGVNFDWFVCHHYSKSVCEFLSELSESFSTSDGIGVPTQILEGDNGIKAAFLGAFWDDEGSISDSGKLEGSLVSKEMIVGLSKLHFDLGIENKVYTNKKKGDFTVHINKNEVNYLLFQEKIGFSDSLVVHGKNSGNLKKNVLREKIRGYRNHLKLSQTNYLRL
ncbi:MAG: hypothetical protein CL944_02280 [Candidatus Diapherotrites archaeon]|uniref:DOD-type homing endonuclease domain-containing protein n=1 Tax=Candidatus Iainarchaeum sp. TaxID=3101447 RepID=A0A2D6LQ12_9ARCH|nr:hypothetical protein [Candidatus Diapherotrites archaeon]|tara:strand:+ start:24146 stop:25045 length:900 start_codon:yes stop_codon:yes gene_type:complete